MNTEEEKQDMMVANPSTSTEMENKTVVADEQKPDSKSDPLGVEENPLKKRGKERKQNKKANKLDGDREKKKDNSEQLLLQDKLLRLQADFENFRKRMIREKAQLYQFANKDLVRELLPVIDHLDLALDAVNEDEVHNALVEGVKLVREQLLSVLNKFGLMIIATMDQQFDPNLHEAISHVPSEVVSDHGILHETRQGYLLGEKLLRASQVVVSSGPVAKEEGENESTPSEILGE